LLEKIAVIGGGSWCTTLAALLADKGHEVTLWVYEADLAGRMRNTGVNDLYLPGFKLPENLKVDSRLGETVKDKDIIVTVTPSHVTRNVLTGLLPEIKEGAFLSLLQGHRNDTL
jgi:glycerol-3-phosphate dehydrogenase (NAD(P)+)